MAQSTTIVDRIIRIHLKPSLKVYFRVV